MTGNILTIAVVLRILAIRNILVTALIAVSVIASSAIPSFAQAIFSGEGAAQAHCPGDVVVWLNIPTHIYHEQGMRWYGRTKNGAYVCKTEANRAGDRDTRNGQ
jgi:hypothetical protein